MATGSETVDTASQAILTLLSQRDEQASICPSEAARSLAAGSDFRPFMPVVRDAARALVDRGQIEVLQRGRVVDLDAARGPVRLRAARPAATRRRPSPHESGEPMARTDDGRYVIINGRRWRASNPALSEPRRAELVSELMAARRAVGVAKRANDAQAEQGARERVHAAKIALGERGTPWWGSNQQG